MLRRRANEIATQTHTPRRPPLDSPASPSPRISIGYITSPCDAPSISASRPFDWDAARQHKPPPYQTPPQPSRLRAKRLSTQNTPGDQRQTKRRLVRKKSLWQRISDIPSRIAWEISVFPNNLPLPEQKTSACILGGALHSANFIIHIYRKATEPRSALEELMDDGLPWFHWTNFLPAFLFLLASLNTLYLFTRFKVYHLHHRSEPAPTPHASFVPDTYASFNITPPPMWRRLASTIWQLNLSFWRFLFNLAPPPPPVQPPSTVQRLEVWNPEEFELGFFCIYSPAHSFLWWAMDFRSLIVMAIVMVAVGAQSQFLVHSFKGQVKDKSIIAEEVMHEYNDKFVYPRINPVRKDQAVMTHQSEVVNVWED